MFGIILALGELFARGVYSLRETYSNEMCKKTSVTEDGLCYIDMKGRRRLLSNDHVAHLSVNPWTEDTVLIDVKTQRIVKNFSAEKRAKNKKRNLEIMERNGNSVYYIDPERVYREDSRVPKGVRFYDRETNECYVIREIDEVRWFMRVSDGQLIRKTDWQLSEMHRVNPEKATFEHANKFIKERSIGNDIRRNFRWKDFYDCQEIKYLERGIK